MERQWIATLKQQLLLMGRVSLQLFLLLRAVLSYGAHRAPPQASSRVVCHSEGRNARTDTAFWRLSDEHTG